MKLKHLKIVLGGASALLAVVLVLSWVFREMSGGSFPGVGKIKELSRHAGAQMRNSKTGHGKGAPQPRGASDEATAQEPQPLLLPVLPVEEKNIEKPADEAVASTAARQLPSDDDILAMGGVVPGVAKPVAEAGDPARGPRSIKSADWKGAANLLVNALRAGDRFEVNHDQLMEFLRGKDLLGWPEGYRNWIGDELMTALRQDMPKSAFEDLKSIAADSRAPAAMRDYSVQHISHLVTGGVIGKEGADFIWQTLEKNDPQTLSTALISLHRLSEQVPDLVVAKQVQATAERLKDSPEERTRITAESILKHGAAIQSRK